MPKNYHKVHHLVFKISCENTPSKLYETQYVYLRIVNGSVDLARLKVPGYFKHDA